MRTRASAATALYAAILTMLAAALVVPAPAAGGEAARPESPFIVTVHAGLESIRPGEELPVAIVFDIAEKHKIYDDDLSALEVGLAPDEGAKLVGKVKRPLPHEKFDSATGKTRRVHEGRAVFRFAVEASGPEPGEAGRTLVKVRVRFEGCSETICFLPDVRTLELAVPVRPEGAPAVRANAELFEDAYAEPAAAPDDFTGRSPLVAILFAFLFGIALSFTPCVYPLVPVTLAVIGAKSAEGGWRRGLALSLVYVLGLSVTYAALGVIVAKGGATVGATSTHWVVVTAVGIVFLALAASLFGVYDLEMPASWQAKLRMGRKGGPVGVFAMGLLSGLVATPCVAAPLYTVLTFIARTGSVFLGGAMLFAMAWGMGVILVLVGTFSGLQSKLPKAGGWMLKVKTALGVIVVVAALYFLRPVLPAGAFAAWFAIPLIAIGVWRGVIVRAAPDAPRGVLALRAAGIATLVFGLYLGGGALVRAGMPAPGISYLYPDEIVPSPSLVEFRTDYAAALAEARAARRPVMLDFVKPNCPGCRELEHNVFSREDVARESEAFVRVRVDINDPPVPVEELKDAYGIEGAPTVVWLDGDGKPMHDLTVADGGIAPEEFLRRMREAK
jgi:thiol:disulfide interchange protein DsbD